MDIASINSVGKYFWGDNLEELNWEKHSAYIVKTLLDKGDGDAVRWLFAHKSRDEIQAMLPLLKLSAKSAHFWQLYLSKGYDV